MKPDRIIEAPLLFSVLPHESTGELLNHEDEFFAVFYKFVSHTFFNRSKRSQSNHQPLLLSSLYLPPILSSLLLHQPLQPIRILSTLLNNLLPHNRPSIRGRIRLRPPTHIIN